MSPNERDDVTTPQLEDERDRALSLAWESQVYREDSPVFLDDRFLEWLSSDARARACQADSWDPVRVNELAERMRLRVLERQLKVRAIEGETISVSPPGSGLLDSVAEPHSAALLDMGVAAGSGRELWDVECDEWIRLPDDIPRGRYIALTVRGDSMLPLLHSDDIVLVRLGQGCASDTVIVARRPDEGHVVKRVGRISSSRIELLSLNGDFAPITIPRQSDLVVGTVVAKWCKHDKHRERKLA